MDIIVLIKKVYLAQDSLLKANNNLFNLLLDNFLCSLIFLLKIVKIDCVLSCLFQADETYSL